MAEHTNDEIVVYDRSSYRANTAMLNLISRGFSDVKVLLDGLIRWIEVYGKNKVIPKPKAQPPAAPAEPAPPQPDEPEPHDPAPPRQIAFREASFRGSRNRDELRDGFRLGTVYFLQF